MSAPRTVLVELSEEQAKWIDDRVAEGEYLDAGQAVAAGIDQLSEEKDSTEPAVSDLSLEQLREAVGPVYDKVMAGRATGYTMDEVRAYFEAYARDYVRPA